VNFDEWMKLIGLMVAGLTAIVGVVTVVTTILVNFGRRHRLRLAIEVRDSIAKDQRTEWDWMIFHDAAKVMASADQPISAWPLFAIAWAIFATSFLPFLPNAVETTLVAIAVVLTLTAAVVHLVYLWRRHRRFKRLNERFDEIEDDLDERERKLDEKESAMDEKESALDAEEECLEQLRLHAHRLASYAAFVAGAPMRTVRDARADPIDATNKSIVKHFDHPVWRLRASMRLRNLLGRRRAARFAHGLRPEELQRPQESLRSRA
jgi:hypothetical protein